MAKVKIYSIWDEKAEEYSPPFFNANDRLAIRTVRESAKGGMLMAYPEDFRLYRIGSYDSSTGEIEPEVKPLLVISVKEAIKEVKNNAEN